MSSTHPTGKKRILFLNYEYPPLGGGAANATRHILNEYTDMGDVEVDLVTSALNGKSSKISLAENVRIHFVPIGNKEGNLHHQTSLDILLYTWNGFWKAVSLMRKNKYDAVHAFFGIPCGFMTLLLKVFFKTPYIVSLRGSDVPGYSDRFKIFYPFLTPIIRLIWKKANAVVANSKGLKELAHKTNQHQEISVIPNGVDVEQFQPSATTKDSETVVITTGATRITERKGIRYLLEAVEKLRLEYPHIRVEVMGEGSEKENLISFVKEKQLESQVTFLGRIPADQTIEFYARADIFVLPSFNEGMSNALLEAMAVGLPAIVTDTGGSHELVTSGKNGLYIEMKNSESIADALRTLLNDPLMRKQLGEESRKRALEQSWKMVAEQYKGIYQQVSE